MAPTPRLSQGAEGLDVVWGDGLAHHFAWTWLRDACPCDWCRADGGGQRLLDLTTLHLPVAAPTAVIDGDAVHLDWPEGAAAHRSTWSLHSLRAWGERTTGRAARASSPPRPVAGPPVLRRTWDEVRDGSEGLAAVLEAVVAHGVALVTGVPTRPDAVREVVATFGHVRATNYGEVFDVRPVVDPDNLANSHVGLGPHTDNPYRSPTPSVQVLHCLRSSLAGGETVLVDGAAAADRLADEAPSDRRLLERWPWTWHWHDAANELEATAAVLDVDPDGRLRQVRFNERSRLPAVCPPEVAPSLIAALRRYALLLGDPAGQTRLRLAAGDTLIMDNLRVLHGRTAFESAGDRHLQGAYSDLDGLRSRLAVLRRPGPPGRRRLPAGRPRPAGAGAGAGPGAVHG